MACETLLTIIGNLTSDPELRFTSSGSAVASFTIASTSRIYDRKLNEWRNGETLFLRASIWRDAAEHVAESLSKGMRVIANGKLKSKSFETKEGEKRTILEIDLEDIGPSLRYTSVKVVNLQRKDKKIFSPASSINFANELSSQNKHNNNNKNFKNNWDKTKNDISKDLPF